MSPGTAQEVCAAARSHPYACGWRDKNGQIRISWGNQNERSSSLSLRFRFFHGQSAPADGPWQDIPASGLCCPENSTDLALFPRSRLAPLSLGEFKELPGQDLWNSYCAQIEAELLSGRLHKVVPVRRREFSLEPEIKARLLEELLPRLFSGDQDGTYRFFLKWNGGWFFGATPEILFRKEDGYWQVPAIAGTRPVREENAKAMEAELLSDPKERAEHALVVKGIVESLRELGLSPEVAEQPQILRLRGLIHLFTPVRALDSGISSATLLEKLHPTAAVGGYPQGPAKNFLLQKEPEERGLFASPLLFQDGKNEICLVGIRSGLIEGDSLHLFAGAGYVSGSKPENEWNETGRKMDFLRRLLEEEGQ